MKKITFILFIAWLNSGLAQTTVPNGGFETWSDEYNAESWDGFNYSGTWLNFHTFTRSDDAHTGNYAAQVENVNDELLGLIPGVAFTGTFDFDPLTYEYTFQMGIPITGRPTSLNGYFKYTPVGGDTMFIVVGMFKWNEQEMDLDSIGGGIYYTGNTVGIYTNFHIPIQYYSNDDADTMYIMMAPSTDTYHEGSKLLVDDLTLSYNPSGVENDISESYLLFPNPASDLVFLEAANDSGALFYTISDITGISVLSGKIDTAPIDVSYLREGLYFLRVSNSNNQVSTQKIIVRH